MTILQRNSKPRARHHLQEPGKPLLAAGESAGSEILGEKWVSEGKGRGSTEKQPWKASDGVELGLSGWVEQGRKNEQNGQLRIEDIKESAS